MSGIKRIPVDKLEIGMYITDENYGIADASLKGKGFIRREETLAKLKAKSIGEVLIDTSKGRDSAYALPLIIEEIELEPLVPFEEERECAGRIYSQALDMVDMLMQQVKLGKAIDVTPVEDLAGDISQSLNNNKNAMLCLTQIREKGRYLMEHSLNCGILMGVFSRHLGYDSDSVNLLVTAGMLHDIGMIRIDDRLLSSPGKPNPEEWRQIHLHVQHGAEALQNVENASEELFSVCSQHHERLDASGYPLGLDHRSINMYGRMAAIVDSYDAMTSNRVFQASTSPFAAMRELSQLGDRKLDKNLVYQFIRCMGVYPVGALVELSNGRLGVVIQTHLKKPNQPVVRVFYNVRHKHQEKVQVVDLSSPLVEAKIVGTCSREELGIDINDFL